MTNFDQRYWITRPAVLIPDEPQVKLCRKCGAEFCTASRVKKRCNACQSAVTAARGIAAVAARRARKAARR